MFGWIPIAKIVMTVINFLLRRQAVKEGEADATDKVNEVAGNRIDRVKRARDSVRK